MADNSVNIKVELDDSDATRKLNNLKVNIQKVGDTKLDIDTTSADKAIEKTEDKVKELTESVHETNNADSKLTWKGIAQGSDSAKIAAASIGQLGGELTDKITKPIVDAGKASITTAASFDDAMAQVAGSLDKPADEMGNLRQLALDLGSSTVFSATEAGQAMVELAKGGMTEAQIQGGALAASMDLAAAGGMNLADAANVTVQMMGAFGLSAADAASISDALAGAANASSADVSDLAQAMSQCSAQAHLAGWSLQDTSAALALFADNGVRGSDAGTSLKTMLQRLAAPTDEAAAAMAQYGIEARNSDGSMKSVSEIAQTLHDRMGSLSEAQRDQAMQTIFGSDASRAAAIMMQAGADGLAKYQQATQNATAAETMASAQKGQLSWAMENMSGAIETAAIALGTTLAPVIQVVAGVIGDLATGFANLPGPVQVVIAVIGALIAAIGPIILMIGTFMLMLPSINAGLEALGAVFGSTIAPVLLIGAAIAAFIAILVYLWNTSEGFRNAVTTAMDTINAKVQEVLAFLQPYIEQFFTAIQGLIDTVLPIIMQVIEAAMTFILDVVTPVLSVLLDTIGNTFAIILQTITSVMDGVSQIIQGAWQVIQGIFQTVVGLIVGLVTGDFSMMSDGVGQIFTGLSSVVSGILTALSGIIGGILGTIASLFTGILNGAAAAVGGIFRGISDTIGNVMGGAKDLVKGALDSIANFFSGLHLEFPKIKLPHFSIEGEFSLAPPSVPHLAIDWYRTGAIATGASVIGVGEDGTEAIVPLSNKRYMKPFADAVAENMYSSNAQQSSSTVYNINISVEAKSLQDMASIEDFVAMLQLAKRANPVRSGR